MSDPQNTWTHEQEHAEMLDPHGLPDQDDEEAHRWHYHQGEGDEGGEGCSGRVRRATARCGVHVQEHDGVFRGVDPEPDRHRAGSLWEHSLSVRNFAAICVRAMLVSLAAGLCTAAALWVGDGLAAATHGWIMGVGALLFAVSEGFFARLLTELNGVLRATGYSVWQAERLRAMILPFKAKLWRLWWVSQGLKVVSGVCAVILQKQVLSAANVQTLLWVGYSALFLAVGCMVWSVRSFLYVEKARDDLAMEEVTIKEKRRLSGEVKDGPAHDFGADSSLQGYAKNVVREVVSVGRSGTLVDWSGGATGVEGGATGRGDDLDDPLWYDRDASYRCPCCHGSGDAKDCTFW